MEKLSHRKSIDEYTESDLQILRHHVYQSMDNCVRIIELLMAKLNEKKYQDKGATSSKVNTGSKSSSQNAASLPNLICKYCGEETDQQCFNCFVGGFPQDFPPPSPPIMIPAKEEALGPIWKVQQFS